MNKMTTRHFEKKKVNAREELLGMLGSIDVLCATIEVPYEISTINKKKLHLKIGYSDEEWMNFLEYLDFDYTGAYEKAINGTIWLTDGTWLTRKDYYERERWVHRRSPSIPSFLK